jgi:hypothetical protein
VNKRHSPVLLLALMLTGCNFYDFLDNPSGDTQLLSAARACFDQGDFTCSSNYYSQISSSTTDQAAAEQAFLILSQNGASMSTFMTAAVSDSSSGGKFVTRLAKGLATANRGTTARVNLFQAFKKVNSIQGTQVQGLVRFITASAFLGEILAENSATLGTFLKTDLVTDPTTCAASSADLTGCNAPSSNVFTSGTTLSLSTATDTDISVAAPTLHMVVAAVNEIQTGINQMGATGTLGNSTGTFASNISDSSALISTSPAGFRRLLITLELGE